MTNIRRLRNVRRNVGMVVIAGFGFGCQADRKPTLTLEEFTRKLQTEGGDGATGGRRIDLTRLSEPEMPGADYRIGVGDVLTITVYRLEQADAPSVLTVRVNESGHVALPLVGEIRAAGLHPTALEATINDQLSPRYIRNPQTSVLISAYQQISVMVLGAVREPGRLLLRHDQRTLVHALAMAGGLTDSASGRIVIRSGATAEETESYRIDQEGDFRRALERGPLQDGDILTAVEGPLSLVYISGLVDTPGPIQLPRGGVTVAQAIVAAGGLPTDLPVDQAFLTRRFSDGSQHTVQLDLQQLAMGEIPDFRLAPGDILEVPHTKKTRTAEYVRDNLVFRGGIDATLNPWLYVLTPQYQIQDDSRFDDGGIGREIRRDILFRAARRATEPLGF